MGASPIDLWKAFLAALNRLEEIDAQLGDDWPNATGQAREEVILLVSERVKVTKEVTEAYRALRDGTSVFEDVRDVIAATYGEGA